MPFAKRGQGEEQWADAARAREVVRNISLAEEEGSRTLRPAYTGPHSFEDRGGHRAPSSSMIVARYEALLVTRCSLLVVILAARCSSLVTRGS